MPSALPPTAPWPPSSTTRWEGHRAGGGGGVHGGWVDVCVVPGGGGGRRRGVGRCVVWVWVGVGVPGASGTWQHLGQPRGTQTYIYSACSPPEASPFFLAMDVWKSVLCGPPCPPPRLPRHAKSPTPSSSHHLCLCRHRRACCLCCCRHCRRRTALYRRSAPSACSSSWAGRTCRRTARAWRRGG